MITRGLAVAVVVAATACGAQPSSSPPSASPSTSTASAASSAASSTASSASSSTRSTTATASTATAPTLPSSLVGRVVTRIATTRHVAALTFDAGANGDGVASILATLRRERVPATFFLTGGFASTFPSLARALSSYGVVGDHTVDHPHLPALGDAAVREEVTSARATILRVTGEDPRPLFRFPYGESDARTVRIANGLGFVPIGWTYGSPGYLGTSGGVTVDTVVSRLTAARQPGEILLLHVGSNPDDHTTLDADALPRVITALRDAGFGFVALHVTSSGLSES